MVSFKEFIEDRKKNKASRLLSFRLRRVVSIIIFVIIVSFMVSIIVVTVRERREYEYRESSNTLKTLSENINSQIKSYMGLSRLIMMDDRLVAFLRANEDNVDIGMINDARYGIMDILNVTEGVDSVMVFREDLIRVATNRFSYNYDNSVLRDTEWRQEIYDKKGRPVVGLNSFGVAAKQDGTPMVSIGRAIYDILSQKRTGFMFMNISPKVFEQTLNSLHYDNICIMGTDGTFLAGNRDYMEYYSDEFDTAAIVHKEVSSGRDAMLVSGCCIEGMPVVILRASSYSDEGIPYGILMVFVLLLLVFVVTVFYVSSFVTRNITNPVFEISRSMERNKKSGELKKIDTEIPFGELNMLKDDYNDLIDHVNELIATVIEKEKTVQRAEIRILQEQIKPHFLYNSIETIGFLALEAGADNVHEALETLGSFYRNFLSKGVKEIPLSREVAIVKDYLALQKLRYGDIIEEVYEIDENAETFVVPKLILQPLVENSIYHGIRLKGEKGQIRIKAYVSKGYLYLSVRDTGVGMTKEQIDRLMDPGESAINKSDEESFGLWGTIERIRFYCNTEDVVRIESEVGEYTEVEFRIRNMMLER